MAETSYAAAKLLARDADNALTLTGVDTTDTYFEAGEYILAVVATAETTLTIAKGDSSRASTEDLTLTLAEGTHIIPLDTAYFGLKKTWDGTNGVKAMHYKLKAGTASRITACVFNA